MKKQCNAKIALISSAADEPYIYAADRATRARNKALDTMPYLGEINGLEIEASSLKRGRLKSRHHETAVMSSMRASAYHVKPSCSDALGSEEVLARQHAGARHRK